MTGHTGALPPDALVGGKTQAEWSVDWWHWAWAAPTNQHPLLDTTGEWAHVGQPDGPVFFLAGVFIVSSVQQRTFTVPEGKYMFFPLVNVAPDNVDTIPPFTVEELRNIATAYIDTTTELHASIDGVPVTNLFAYRQKSPVFSTFFPDANNIYTIFVQHPIVGWVDPEVSDGYWLMIEPLPPGTHVINFGATSGSPFDFTLDITDTITVVPRSLTERVAEMLARVESSGLPRKHLRPLLATLRGAEKSFAKDHVKAGIRHLRAFQKKVRHILGKRDATLAEQLIAAAQAIIDRADKNLDKPHSKEKPQP